MAAESAARLTLRQRGEHELKEFAVLTLYFYITLGAVILMKAAVLHAQGVSYVPWGIAAVKAAVLAKFMLLGRIMKIGEYNSDRPLIWPVLQQSVAFLILLVVLTIIEEVVVGLLHRQSVAATFSELTGARLYEFLASTAIVLLVLIPYCAIRVLAEALGEGRLLRMFFVEREPMQRR